jgi:hypothetical protein
LLFVAIGFSTITPRPCNKAHTAISVCIAGGEAIITASSETSSNIRRQSVNTAVVAVISRGVSGLPLATAGTTTFGTSNIVAYRLRPHCPIPIKPTLSILHQNTAAEASISMNKQQTPNQVSW